MILDYPLLENPLTTLLVSYLQRGGYTSGLRSNVYPKTASSVKGSVP
jgi:hypothetical protein